MTALQSSQMCHLYVNDLETSNASPNRLIFEALLSFRHIRLTENLNILLSAKIYVYLQREGFLTDAAVSVYSCLFKWTADGCWGKGKTAKWWNKSKNDTTGASWSMEHLEGKKAVGHTTYVEP